MNYGALFNDLVNVVKSHLAASKIPAPRANPRYFEDHEVLDRFIFNLYAADNLPAEKSGLVIRNNVVKIKVFGQSPYCGHSNGLMISKNGFFITAKHCLDYGSGSKGTVIWNEREYPIQRVCFAPKDHDFALGKAEVPGLPEPMLFKLSPDKEYARRQPATIYTRRNGLLESLDCVLTGSNAVGITIDGSIFIDQITLKADVQQGHSGSPVVNSEGELIGLVSAKSRDYAHCLKTRRALDGIAMYAQLLKAK